jgi:hypothetical protein
MSVIYEGSEWLVKRVSNIDEMILAEKNRVVGELSVSRTLLSRTNPTWSDLELNRGFRIKSSTINRLKHGTASVENKKSVDLKKKFNKQ